VRELDEIFIRSEIQRILSEQTFDATWGDIVPPSGEQFYNTFIGPFVDVYKVATVALKDTADMVLTNIQSAFTFDPEKQKVLMDKFRKRRDKYNSEMAEAMRTTDEALSSPDAQLIMFMANPGVYLGAGMAKEAIDVAEPITDYAADKFGNVSKMLGLGSDYVPPAPPPKGPIAGILGDLKNLFFGPDMSMTTADMGQIGPQSGGTVRVEGLDEIDELERVLKEQDGEGEKKEEGGDEEQDIQYLVDDYLAMSGAGEKIEGYMRDVIDSKKAEAEEVKKQYMDIIEGLNAVAQAKTLEELAQLIPPLAQAGIDLAPAAAELEKNIEEQKKTLEAGGDEADEMIEQLRDTPDGKAVPEDAPAEAWAPIIEQATLAVAFADAVDEAKKQSIGEMIGFVAEMPRPDLELISKASPLGKEFADVIFQLENDLLSV
tara:strand:- start:4457 stop:5749 length:1293 start_codon:yes stop_codon:yes gene_type:complete